MNITYHNFLNRIHRQIYYGALLHETIPNCNIPLTTIKATIEQLNTTRNQLLINRLILKIFHVEKSKNCKKKK